MRLTEHPAQSWLDPQKYWPSLTAATEHLDPPVAALHLDGLRHNTHNMLDRADGSTIRVATKSIRVRSVIESILAVPGYRGVLAYTLAEALWLADTIDDVVVGYPTVDRAALARLGRSPEFAANVTIMVDSVAHLDFVDAVLAPGEREPIRVCLELDCVLGASLLGHLGVRRSPVHTVAEARALAEAIVARPGFHLVGMMAYEAQIAGLGNRPPGKPLEASSSTDIRSRVHRRAA